MRHVRRSVAIAAAVCTLPWLRLAGAAPPATAPAGPVQVIAMGFAPVDNWIKAVEDLAGKEQADKVRALSGQAKGASPITASLRSDGPITVTGYVNTGVPMERSVAVAMPVEAGKMTAADLKTAGGQPVAGSADVFALPDGSYAAKRTANYLLVSSLGDLLGGQTERSLVDAGARPGGALSLDKAGTLFVMSFDLAAWRRGDPAGYDRQMKKMRDDEAAKRPAGAPEQTEGEKAGEDLVYSAIDKVDQWSLAVGADADAVHLSTTISPGGLTAPAARPRPAMPDGCVGRVDLTYATAEQAAWTKRATDWFVGMMKDDMAKDPNAAAGVAIVRRAADDLLAGRSMSVGLKPTADGKFVAYVVEEVDHDPDVAATFGRLADDIHRMSPTETYAATAYDEAGQHVTRFTGGDAANPNQFYVDATGAGHTLRMTVAVDAGHHLAELLSAKADGTTTAKICDGSIDAAALVRLVGKTPGTPLFKLDDATKEQVATLFGGQLLSFSMNPAGRDTLVDVSAPKGMVRTLIQLAMQAQ